jgi:uncharacterized membrane protein
MKATLLRNLIVLTLIFVGPFVLSKIGRMYDFGILIQVFVLVCLVAAVIFVFHKIQRNPSL